MPDSTSVTEVSPLVQGKKLVKESRQSLPLSLSSSYQYLILAVYFTAGVTFYATKENMPFIRALYFCMVTFTTVGFGDFSPTSISCKLFTCLFVFVGLAIIASIVSNVLDYIIEERVKIKKEKINDTFDQQDDAIITNAGNDESRECVALCSVPVPPFALPIIQGLKQSVIIISINILIGTVFYSLVVDDYSLIDAFYLSCMTITTVGYGDIKPTNNYSRGFTILYALLGTIVTANALSKFASAISDYKQAKLEAVTLSNPLNFDSLMAMDVDKSNIGVSKVEFVLYKLKAMGAIDEDIVLRAEAQFYQLDITKTGYLSVEDIVSFEEKCKLSGKYYDV
jgi:hypothetical protein